MENFFGDVHRNLRDIILDKIDGISKGDVKQPRIVILQGESGLGKSRIIKEVYDGLRQTTFKTYGQYWPDLSNGLNEKSVESVRDPLSERKVLGPTDLVTFTWVENSIPTFNWIPVRFEMGSSDFMNTACTQISNSIQLNGLPLLVGNQIMFSATEKISKALFDGIRMLRNSSTKDYVDLMVEFLSVGGISLLPGIGYVFSGSAAASEMLNNKLKQNKALKGRVHIGADSTSLESRASEVASAVREFANSNMPTIVAIEDLQWMDSELPVLLTQLASKVEDHPVIVLATMWPYSETPKSAEDQIRSWVEQGVAELLQVPRLEAKDLIRIVDQYAPRTTNEVKQYLVKRWNNPYLLKLFLAWRPIDERLVPTEQGMKLDMGIEELEGYPNELRKMYEARWQSLDVEVQKALAAAAAAIPTSMPNHAFVIEIIAKAIDSGQSSLGWKSDESAIEDLAAELLNDFSHALATSWLEETEIAEVFRETFLAEIAIGAIDDLISRESQGNLRVSITQQIACELGDEFGRQCWIDISDPRNDRAAFLAGWLWNLRGLTLGSKAELDEDIDLLLKLTIAQVKARSWDYQGACEVLPESLLNLRGIMNFVQDPETLTAAIQIGNWLADSGDINLAREIFIRLVQTCETLENVPMGLVVDCKIALANWTGICEQRAEALTLYHDLASRYLDESSLSAEQEMKIRNGLALWVGENADWAEAAKLYQESIVRSDRVLDPFHHLSLEARRGEARAMGESGRNAEAVSKYRGIYEDCSRRFGDKGPETAEAQRGLARWLLASGSIDEATEMYGQVMENCESAFGVDHFLTLWACIGVVDAALSLKDLDRAAKYLSIAKRNIKVFDLEHRFYIVCADRQEKLNKAIDAVELELDR